MRHLGHNEDFDSIFGHHSIDCAISRLFPFSTWYVLSKWRMILANGESGPSRER